MDDQPLIRDVKREVTDVKTEAADNEDVEDQELQIDLNQGNTNESEVQTVVLQNIEIRENGRDIPIILNNFSNGNSDGNLQIDTIEENVIHTYIIE